MSKKIEPKRKHKVEKMNIDAQKDNLRNTIILGIIIFFTFLLFARALEYNFIGYDDPQYIIDNSLIKNLSIEGVQDIFTTPVIGMYNPLTFLVYMFEYSLFGLDPKGYHFFNLLFHIIAIIMVYKFIFKLTNRYETATIVALLFAIHPMHIAVVTWISQMKTSLEAIFYFSALIYYVKYLKENYKAKNLVFVGIFFILAALSKPSAVTIAPMLFLLDYYFSRKMDKRLFIDKIPFFAIAIFFGILTLVTHSEDSIFKVNQGYSLINNILIANYSIVFYFQKLFLPLNLSTIYPYPDNALYLPIKYYLSIPVIPLILLLIYKAGNFKKEIIFGILFFAISISVLIRIIPSGFFSAANRYSYISYTGLFLIIGQFISYLLDHKFTYTNKLKPYIIPFLALIIGFFVYRTTVRIGKWKDTITLFTDVIAKYPNVPVAYSNRGYAHALLGNHQNAWVDYNTAIALDSGSAQVFLNRALTETVLGKYDEALDDFNKVIELNPNYGAAYFDRALIKRDMNDLKAAFDDFKKAESLGIRQAHDQIEQLNSIIKIDN